MKIKTLFAATALVLAVAPAAHAGSTAVTSDGCVDEFAAEITNNPHEFVLEVGPGTPPSYVTVQPGWALHVVTAAPGLVGCIV